VSEYGLVGEVVDGTMYQESHVGTAGAMFDFSCAAGLEPIVSSFSRRVFSWEMILRVSMVVMLSCEVRAGL
jgi:hypothetical protein